MRKVRVAIFKLNNLCFRIPNSNKIKNKIKNEEDLCLLPTDQNEVAVLDVNEQSLMSNHVEDSSN